MALPEPNEQTIHTMSHQLVLDMEKMVQDLAAFLDLWEMLETAIDLLLQPLVLVKTTLTVLVRQTL